MLVVCHFPRVFYVRALLDPDFVSQEGFRNSLGTYATTNSVAGEIRSPGH